MACCNNEDVGKKVGKVRLCYFDARGGGELIRWILTVGKADWEDCRIKKDDWPKRKAEMPLGQMPVLECTDKEGKKKQLTQSGTIIRTTACWFGLAGKSPCECMQADEVYEVIREVAMKGMEARFEEDANRKEKLGAQVKEMTQRNLTYLEKKLQGNGGKFMAGGENFTYADLAMGVLAEMMMKVHGGNCDEMKTKCPGIHDLVGRVREIPELKAYLAKRPETDM